MVTSIRLTEPDRTQVTSTPAISVQILRARYGRKGSHALNDIGLRVEQGEKVALIGTNGAGKSTLLRCLVRLVEPTGGSITIAGTDVISASRRNLRKVRSEVGFVFQRFHLIPRLTAFHNVVQGAMGRNGTRCAWPLTSPVAVRREAMENLERVGLTAYADRRVDTLSGGQQQRVAIARMMMQRPSVILADEPVASLDPVSARVVLDLMCSIAAERNVTVVMALHQLDLALHYADRVVGLRDGAVAFDQLAVDCDAAQLATVFSGEVS